MLGIFISCAAPPKKAIRYPTELNDAIISKFKKATNAFESKNYETAKKLYEDFLRATGYNPLTDDARIRLGDIALANRDYSTAINLYHQAYSNIYSPRAGPLAQYKEARAFAKKGDYVESLDALSKIQRGDAALLVRADSLAVKDLIALGRGSSEMIQWFLNLIDDYAGLMGPAPDDTPLIPEDEALRQARNWVSGGGPALEEVKSLSVKEGGRSAGYVSYKLGLIYNSRGEYEAARDELTRFTAGYPKHEYYQDAINLLGQLNTRLGGMGFKVGVILPLSGRYAQYGEATLHGIECAAGIYTPCQSSANIQLVVKDDRGDPLAAREAVEELVRGGVGIIIGPLSSSSIIAACEAAQSAQVPLISLSQKDGVTDVGEFIFSNALTSGSIVDGLLDYALGDKGIKTFGVLYPLNQYGEVLKDIFVERAKEKGRTVAFTQGYGPDQASFDGIVQHRVDALFIPDSYRVVGYIASSLAADGFKDIKLMGTNRWNAPDLLQRGGEFIEGVVFVDGFFKESTRPATRGFSSLFTQAFDTEPTVLEAIGFDGLNLASRALVVSGGKHTRDIRDTLAAVTGLEGVTGNTAMGQDREAMRKLFVLTVKDGRIQEITNNQDTNNHQ